MTLLRRPPCIVPKKAKTVVIKGSMVLRESSPEAPAAVLLALFFLECDVICAGPNKNPMPICGDDQSASEASFDCGLVLLEHMEGAFYSGAELIRVFK